MSTPRCSRLWQAEAIADGRLSHPEVAAFERHAGSCAECAREASELERLREVTSLLPVLHASELERRRQRNDLLRAANDATVHAPLVSRTVPRAGLVASAVIGAILITAASAFGLRAAWQELAGRVEPPTAPPAAASGARKRPHAQAAAPQPDVFEQAAPEPAAIEEAVPRAPAPDRAPRIRSKRAALEPHPSIEHAPRAGRAFAEAMAAFTAGDYARAQNLFAAFERAHPSDDRVEDALFLRAVAHARRGDGAASRSVANEYLRRYPEGLRKREAEQLAR